jgi:hypothetical protein
MTPLSGTGSYTDRVSFLLERRLRALGRRLASLREELRLAEEQLAHLADITDDSRIRAMVSETPLADVEHRDAERTSSAMARHRASLLESIRRLEQEQDELLDKLSARGR